MSRDDLNLSDPRAATRFSAEVAPEDPLKIGGQLYWRAMSTGQQGQYPQNWSLRTPALLDVYMDARPNERVRAFGLGAHELRPDAGAERHDRRPAACPAASAQSERFAEPARRPGHARAQRSRSISSGCASISCAGSSSPPASSTCAGERPASGRRPTTCTSRRAIRCLPFDARTGTTMLKLHVPWEAQGWNFYAYALPGERPTATSRTGDVAGAARVEIVLGTFEAGAGVFGRRNSKAKFAGDVSFGVWDLDFYGEAAAAQRRGRGFRALPGSAAGCGGLDGATRRPTWPQLLPGRARLGLEAAGHRRRFVHAQVRRQGHLHRRRRVLLQRSRLLRARRTIRGCSLLPRDQPLANPATFFYLGRHYLGVFATRARALLLGQHHLHPVDPGEPVRPLRHHRLDYSLIVLTHVRFEAYGAVHWGQRNGEFRLAIDSASSAMPTHAPSAIVWRTVRSSTRCRATRRDVRSAHPSYLRRRSDLTGRPGCCTFLPLST